MKIRYADAGECIPSYVFASDSIKIIHKPSGKQLEHCLRANAEEGWVDRMSPKNMHAIERVECEIDIVVDDRWANTKKLMSDIMSGVYFDHDLSEDERVAREREIMGDEKPVFHNPEEEGQESYRDWIYKLTGKVPASCMTADLAYPAPDDSFARSLTHDKFEGFSIMMVCREDQAIVYARQLDDHFGCRSVMSICARGQEKRGVFSVDPFYPSKSTRVPGYRVNLNQGVPKYTPIYRGLDHAKIEPNRVPISGSELIDKVSDHQVLIKRLEIQVEAMSEKLLASFGVPAPTATKCVPIEDVHLSSDVLNKITLATAEDGWKPIGAEEPLKSMLQCHFDADN